MEVIRLRELRELDAVRGEDSAGAVVVIGLVRLAAVALGKILGVFGVEVGVPVLEGARADARRRVRARRIDLAQRVAIADGQTRGARDPTQYKNDDHGARDP